MALLVFMVGTALPAVPSPIANSATSTNPDLNNPAYINSIVPGRISDSDLAKVKQITLADSRIQGVLNGKSYQFMGTDYMSTNLMQVPPIWNPEIHINMANTTQVSVLVDLNK